LKLLFAKSNDKMKTDIELLFKDYTKPIGYESTLVKCRSNDDWETITQKWRIIYLK